MTSNVLCELLSIKQLTGSLIATVALTEILHCVSDVFCVYFLFSKNNFWFYNCF